MLHLVLPQGKSKEGKASQEQMALIAGAAALRTFLEPEEKEGKEKEGAAGPGACLPQRLAAAGAVPLPHAPSAQGLHQPFISPGLTLGLSLISNISFALLAVQLTH